MKKQTQAIRTQLSRETFKEHSVPLYMTSSYVFDDEQKVEDFSITVNFNSDYYKGFSFARELMVNLNGKYGDFIEVKEEGKNLSYEWESVIKGQKMTIHLSYEDQELRYSQLPILDLDLGISLDEDNDKDPKVKVWYQFVSDVVNEEPYFFWEEHGAEDIETEKYYKNYFTDEYVKEVLKGTSYADLEQGTFKGQECKNVIIAIASSSEVVGSTVHFKVTEEGVQVLGMSPYQE